jgi:NitT/TauT family transport system ATP-binding protein
MREAFTLASRVVAFERRRDRPEEKERYGATITKDISIWPPRLAGQSSIFSPDRDGPVALGHGRDDLAPSGEML